MNDSKKLSIFLNSINNYGILHSINYLKDLPKYDYRKTSINMTDRIIIGTYFNIYSQYLKHNINIDKIFTKSETENIFDLIKTVDELNLQLVKQILISKLKTCITSK